MDARDQDDQARFAPWRAAPAAEPDLRTLDDLAREALALAARGNTAPNPRVGALIIAHNEAIREPSAPTHAGEGTRERGVPNPIRAELLGQGWHRAAGLPHAEVEALRDAERRNRDVRGAIMIVSLEPCDHYGRTPPCTEAILRAGIAHVHIALRDPNPIAAGGAERLRAGGVRVTLASEEIQAMAAKQNEAFLRWVAEQRAHR